MYIYIYITKGRRKPLLKIMASAHLNASEIDCKSLLKRDE